MSLLVGADLCEHNCEKWMTVLLLLVLCDVKGMILSCFGFDLLTVDSAPAVDCLHTCSFLPFCCRFAPVVDSFCNWNANVDGVMRWLHLPLLISFMVFVVWCIIHHLSAWDTLFCGDASLCPWPRAMTA